MTICLLEIKNYNFFFCLLLGFDVLFVIVVSVFLFLLLFSQPNYLNSRIVGHLGHVDHLLHVDVPIFVHLDTLGHVTNGCIFCEELIAIWNDTVYVKPPQPAGVQWYLDQRHFQIIIQLLPKPCRLHIFSAKLL